jgi:transcriptional regulator with XRE-family HTH domain
LRGEGMDIKKFGAYISKLRKAHDLTQSQLAESLNVTRQAVSKWEMGDSFPDISLLPKLSDIFGISVDQLLNYGESPKEESKIMIEVVKGMPEHVVDMLQNNELPVESVVNVAPIIKPSTLNLIAEGLGKHGIDIRHIVELATYINESRLTNLLKRAESLENLNEEMLEKFVPFLDQEAKDTILSKIIDGELESSLLKILIPYLDPSRFTLIEAAVLEGQIDEEILKNIQRENLK